nr:hypothetical protein CFP56_07674 [Quercus suber]
MLLRPPPLRIHSKSRRLGTRLLEALEEDERRIPGKFCCRWTRKDSGGYEWKPQRAVDADDSSDGAQVDGKIERANDSDDGAATMLVDPVTWESVQLCTQANDQIAGSWTIHRMTKVGRRGATTSADVESIAYIMVIRASHRAAASTRRTDGSMSCVQKGRRADGRAGEQSRGGGCPSANDRGATGGRWLLHGSNRDNEQRRERDAGADGPWLGPGTSSAVETVPHDLDLLGSFETSTVGLYLYLPGAMTTRDE